MSRYKEIHDFNEDSYYLYRHIRHDKDEVFYIGIGSKCHWNKSFEKRYMRAFSKRSRSDKWNSIANKTSYDVDILYTSNDKKEIERKEIEFIELYGRSDLKIGTLCNLTDGGDTNFNPNPSVWEKRKETMIKNGTYLEMKYRLSKLNKLNNTGKPSPRRKKVYVYNLDGSLYKIYDSKTDASNDLNINTARISTYIDKNTNFKNFIFYYRDMGVLLQKESFKVVKNRKLGNSYQLRKKVNLIELSTGNIFSFESRSEASIFLCKPIYYINNLVSCGGKLECNGYKICLL